MDLPGFPGWTRPARVALVGIGNELNGDDAVGVRVVRDLAGRLGSREDLLLLEAGTAPENFTGPLRRFGPDLVLLVDAASLDQPPGTTMTVGWADIDGFSASTHTLPPSVFARFLVAELGCRLALVGIQPAQLEFGEPLSPLVRAAADRLAGMFELWLTAPPAQIRIEDQPSAPAAHGLADTSPRTTAAARSTSLREMPR